MAVKTGTLYLKTETDINTGKPVPGGGAYTPKAEAGAVVGSRELSLKGLWGSALSCSPWYDLIFNTSP